MTPFPSHLLIHASQRWRGKRETTNEWLILSLYQALNRHWRERMLAMRPMGLTVMTDIQTFALWRHFKSTSYAVSFSIMFPSDEKTNNFPPFNVIDGLQSNAFSPSGAYENFFFLDKLKYLWGTWSLFQFSIRDCYSSICYAMRWRIMISCFMGETILKWQITQYWITQTTSHVNPRFHRNVHILDIYPGIN